MTPLSVDQTGAQCEGSTPISTGHLPAAQQVRRLVRAAYERFKSDETGRNADHYPALATVPSQLFGVSTPLATASRVSVRPSSYPRAWG